MAKDKPIKPEKAEKTYVQFLAAFMLNDYAGIASKEGLTVDEASKKISPFEFGTIIRLAYERFIDRKQLRNVIRILLGSKDHDLTDDERIDMECVFQLGWYILYKDKGYA